MLVAQRHQPAAAEPHDLPRRRSAWAPQPETEMADEHQALRVRELAAIAELVLGLRQDLGHRDKDRLHLEDPLGPSDVHASALIRGTGPDAPFTQRTPGRGEWEGSSSSGVQDRTSLKIPPESLKYRIPLGPTSIDRTPDGCVYAIRCPVTPVRFAFSVTALIAPVL